MIAKKIEDRYQKLSQKDHVLRRPGMYAGSVNTEETLMYTVDMVNLDEIKVVKKVINYNPAFLKLFDEIISNASDASNRSNNVTYIKTWVDKVTNMIIVENDCEKGGIPVEIHPVEKCYVPELIFAHFLSGENYDDTDERVLAGTNGIGSKLVFCLSEYGKVECADGKKSFEQEYKDNLSVITEPVIKKSNKFYVRVTYRPDFKQFKGIDTITDDMESLFLKRIVDLCAYNPKVKFYYNDTLVKVKSSKDWMKLHVPENVELILDESNSKWIVGVCKSPSEQFESVSIVSSVSTFKGGTHINYLSMTLSKMVAESFSKKIKASWVDVRSKIMLMVIAKVKNPSFDSQSKETLSTQITKEVLDGFTFQESFIKKIMKSDIVQSILDAIEIKEKLELSRLEKSMTKVKVEGLIDANSKNRDKCEIFLFEGLSASAAGRQHRDPQTQAIYTLGGKFINVYDMAEKKILESPKARDLMNAIGLRLGKNIGDVRYGKIIITCDSDLDGYAITSQIINFLNLWPQLFEKEMIYLNITPLITVQDKELLFFYNMKQFEEYSSTRDLSGKEVLYRKGLGSMEEPMFKTIMSSSERKLVKLTKGDICDDTIKIWFSDDSEPRKIQLIR